MRYLSKKTHRLMCKCSQVVCLVKLSNKSLSSCSNEVHHDSTLVISIVMYVTEHIYCLCGLVKIFFKKFRLVFGNGQNPRESNMGREGVRK